MFENFEPGALSTLAKYLSPRLKIRKLAVRERRGRCLHQIVRLRFRSDCRTIRWRNRRFFWWISIKFVQKSFKITEKRPNFISPDAKFCEQGTADSNSWQFVLRSSRSFRGNLRNHLRYVEFRCHRLHVGEINSDFNKIQSKNHQKSIKCYLLFKPKFFKCEISNKVVVRRSTLRWQRWWWITC